MNENFANELTNLTIEGLLNAGEKIPPHAIESHAANPD
jgi:hypothetical protein